MARSSKASLVTPNDGFAKDGKASGVWKRNTVTSSYQGTKVILRTETPSSGTTCCDLIRVGDEFFVVWAIGNHKKQMQEYQEIWEAVAQRDTQAQASATLGNEAWR